MKNIEVIPRNTDKLEVLISSSINKLIKPLVKEYYSTNNDHSDSIFDMLVSDDPELHKLAKLLAIQLELDKVVDSEVLYDPMIVCSHGTAPHIDRVDSLFVNYVIHAPKDSVGISVIDEDSIDTLTSIESNSLLVFDPRKVHSMYAYNRINSPLILLQWEVSPRLEISDVVSILEGL